MRTIAYFLRVDEYMSRDDDLRYDVLRQYITADGVVDDDIEYENCTVAQGIARLKQFSVTLALALEEPPP